MSGWIKIHRKMLDNPVVCKDSDHLAVWIYLLLNATHKEIPAMFAGNKIMLEPGQLITGRVSISEQLSVSESKVKRILLQFESDQQIERQRSNKNSIISIVNWHKYQLDDHQNDQQMTNKRPANDQQVTTNKNERTKEIKELKESAGAVAPISPKKFVPPSLEEVQEYCLERGKGVDPQRWHDYQSARGWMIGKNKMKDWKAAVRTWESDGTSGFPKGPTLVVARQLPTEQEYKQMEQEKIERSRAERRQMF